MVNLAPTVSCSSLGKEESGPVTPVAPHLGGSLAVRTSSMVLYGCVGAHVHLTAAGGRGADHAEFDQSKSISKRPTS